MVDVIVGTTGSGKTDLAIKLADDNTYVIGSDVNQAYIGLEVITDAKKRFKHSRFIADTDIGTTLSVFEWFHAVKDLLEHKYNFLIVGGSSMYIFTLLAGISPVRYFNQRRQAAAYLDSIGKEKALKLLNSICDKEHPSDPHRLTKFIEAYICDGVCLHQIWQNKIHINKTFRVIYKTINHELNIVNCKNRIDAMIKNGAIDIVRQIRAKIGPNLMSIIGVSEIMGYLDNIYSLEECKDIMLRRTKKLIRRQNQWLRNKIIPYCHKNKIEVIYQD